MFDAPEPCRFGFDVQILRLAGQLPPGPLQVVHHAEPFRETTKPSRKGGSRACGPEMRAADPSAGGSVRFGRQFEQLATTMPPTAHRFWTTPPRAARDRSEARRPARAERRVRKRKGEDPATSSPAQPPEGSAGRNPMTVVGRDWAGDEYYYVFMVASEAVGQGRRHVLIQGRTHDFEGLELRVRQDDAGASEWAPFDEAGDRRGRRRRPDPPALAAVLDEAGNAVTAHCAAGGFEPRGLVGSISVVDQVYHYFYTDVMPSDCEAGPAKRRMGLYLRTSRDLAGTRVWSRPATILENLPPDTLVRIARGKDMARWAVAYTCNRPATAAGGPVADLCLQYSADLSPGSISALSLFDEPAFAARSSAYLGLRSGGDGGGRFDRGRFYWMTDRYGNLDAPATFPGKGGLLTWFDRLAPRSDGSRGSSFYGRPVFWSTWTVRPR